MATTLLSPTLWGDDFWVDTKAKQSVRRSWDTLILAGEVWPGILKLYADVDIAYIAGKRHTNINNPDDPPTFKITLTDQGYNPAKIKATLELWEKGDWDKFKNLLPLISPKKTTSLRNAFAIVHPATSLLGIDSVIVNHVSLPTPVNQTLVVGFDFTQWFEHTKIPLLHSTGGSTKGLDNVPTPIKSGDNVKS